jgi:hypothetical protein
MNKLLSLAALTLAIGCGQPQLQVSTPLSVVNFAPHDGAVGIGLTTVPTVCFNREMDVSTASGAMSLELEGGAAVAGLVVAETADAHCLALHHEPLAAETAHLIRVKAGAPSADGTELAVELTARFRTGVQ